MNKNILFIIDESELKYFEFNDLVTNFWFIKEFIERGSRVNIAVKSDLFIENALGCVNSHTTYIKNNDIFYEKAAVKSLINDFDVVFFRPDPPVDIDYINACYVFDFVDKEKTLLINNPSAIKDFNEKFHINYFPEYVPENIVTASKELIIEFVAKNKEAVLKPLNRCFGSGVYYLNIEDKNLATIVNDMTDNEKTRVMVQKYLPEVKEGDKRVLIIGEDVMEECIGKLPANNNFKFAIHGDNYFADAKLTENERIAAKNIAKTLSERGLYLAGLDVINEKVIEINITSPCYFIREINMHYGIRFQDRIMACLEKIIENHFSRERVYAGNR